MNRFALSIDVALLAALLLLLSPRLTGLPVHEWLGLTLVLIVLVHLLQSWSWIVTRARGLASRASRRARVNDVLNCALFVLIVLEITSGLVISAVVLPTVGVNTINDRSWRALHNLTLNWTLLVLGLHVAMNWRPLVSGLRRHVQPRGLMHG